MLLTRLARPLSVHGPSVREPHASEGGSLTDASASPRIGLPSRETVSADEFQTRTLSRAAHERITQSVSLARQYLRLPSETLTPAAFEFALATSGTSRSVDPRVPFEAAQIKCIEALLSADPLKPLFAGEHTPAETAVALRSMAAAAGYSDRPVAFYALAVAFHQMRLVGSTRHPTSLEMLAPGFTSPGQVGPTLPYDHLRGRLRYSEATEAQLAQVAFELGGSVLNSRTVTFDGETVAGELGSAVAIESVKSGKAPAALVPAIDALRLLEYEGRFFHSSPRRWSGPIQVLYTGPRDVYRRALGDGFYTSIDPEKYGRTSHQKEVQLPLTAFKAATALIVGKGPWEDEPPALGLADIVIDVNNQQRWVTFKPRAQSLLDAARVLDVDTEAEATNRRSFTPHQRAVADSVAASSPGARILWEHPMTAAHSVWGHPEMTLFFEGLDGSESAQRALSMHLNAALQQQVNLIDAHFYSRRQKPSV